MCVVGIKGHRGAVEVNESGNIFYKTLGFKHDVYTPICDLLYRTIIGAAVVTIDGEDIVFILTDKNIIKFFTIQKYSITFDYPDILIQKGINSIFSIRKIVRFEPVIMYDQSESEIYPFYFSCINMNGVNVMYGVHGFVIEYNYIQPIFDRDCYCFKDYLHVCSDLCFKYPVSVKSVYNYNTRCAIGILQSRKVLVRIDNEITKNITYRSKGIPKGVFDNLTSWGWWITRAKENTFELYIIYTYSGNKIFTQTIKIDN